MLILGRKLDETIMIDGGRIVVRVVEIRGDRVRLGFTADESITIHREEIQAKVDRGEKWKWA